MITTSLPAATAKAAVGRPEPPRWNDPDAVASVERPKRWDRPFGAEMTPDQVTEISQRPEFSLIDADVFPASIPLDGIIANDTRLMRFEPGELVLREGDYGHSAFLVLSGDLRVVIAPGLSDEVLGRGKRRRRSWLRAFQGLLPSRRVPDAREPRQAHGLRSGAGMPDEGKFNKVDVAEVIGRHRTKALLEGDLFGELAALTRLPRRASVFAETEAVLLEIRWQGLRELRRFDSGWRERIGKLYQENALSAQLRASKFFSDLPEPVLREMAREAIFETYGSFDWHHARRRERRQGGTSEETLICDQGDYPDGLLLIGSGFARVSIRQGSVRRTLTHLAAGDVFGLHELYRAWRTAKEGEEPATDAMRVETALAAIGYVDIIRIPAHLLEKHIFPLLDLEDPPYASLASRPLMQDSLIHWAGDEHFINGTATMLIDLQRCVRCDECVRACAATHGGNPRFLRSGPVHDHWMVAHACMHCIDPVCMIDCPTGAIHRERETGAVIINPESCIGCATCADSCPYGNIRMVELCDTDGRSIVDETTRAPISRATKCDLCIDNFGGPACVRACPQDALTRVNFIQSAARSQRA